MHPLPLLHASRSASELTELQPEEQVPLHKEHGIKDWDDPPGAIEWERMANELLYVKANGRTSDSHYSHDHLNLQKPVEVDRGTTEGWKKKFSELQTLFAQRGEDVVWVVVDGFLLYWDPVSLSGAPSRPLRLNP